MGFFRYYTAKEVLAFTGVTYRQLGYWIKKGLIKPSGRVSHTSGSPRLFTFRDLVEIKTIKSLTDSGLKLSALKECVKQLRKRTPELADEAFTSVRLITDGRSVFRYLSQEDKLESLDDFGQFGFTFGVTEQVRGVYKAIGEPSRPIRYTRKKASNE